MNKTKEIQKDIQNIISDNIKYIVIINNKYKHLGYTIYLNNNGFEISYKNSKYFLSVKKRKNDYYWHLNPYNNSYFETKISDSISSLDMVMCAIEDHELFYKKGNLNEN